MLVGWAERLNWAAPSGLMAPHWPEMIALLGIVFGGAFLLFSYRHYDYFAGITGFLLGAWVGAMARAQYLSDSRLSPLVYMGAFAVGGACTAVFYRRFVGILLGGVFALCATLVFCPNVLQSSPNQNLSFPLIFLMGGGLGALFPKFFYVVNTSVLGAGFITGGVVLVFGPKLAVHLPQTWATAIHLLVFLPCLLFGILYQFVSTRDETDGAVAAAGGGQQIIIHAR